jgi:hypothetical protein
MFFGKQDESSVAPSHATAPGGYGITELIRLLKIIPIDHDAQLVVQVIKTTLESVGVKSSFVIEDAIAQEKGIRDAMDMLENQIVVLRQEILAREEQIAQLDVALRETVGAKNLLANAETPPDVSSEIDLNQAQLVEPPEPVVLPPPLPPPRRKGTSSMQPAQGR